MSAQVLAHNPRQLKHRDLRLAKHGQQLGICVDGTLVGGVLQVVGLDVIPQFFDHLRARHGLGANHGGQGVAGLESGSACAFFLDGRLARGLDGSRFGGSYS